MAKVTESLFVNAKTGKKKDGSGDWAIVNVVNMFEDGSAAPAAMWTDPGVVCNCERFPGLSPVELQFETAMTERGPQQELSGVRLKKVPQAA